MATTTNFGWETPDDTDLVKDGAAAMRTLGSAIDTSFVDLKGGTTGQVLSKASNTDLDYTWVTQDDANAIQNAIVDAKGDLIAASAADTPARLAVGANDLLLTAASGEATGLKYTGAWTSFTPTWQSGFTIGNGTQTAGYCKIGKIVHVKVAVTLGSTSAVTGSPTITNPVAGGTFSGGYQQNALILDAGTAYYIGIVDANGSYAQMNTTYVAGTYPSIGSVNATTPMTWTTNDQFAFSYWYEAA